MQITNTDKRTIIVYVGGNGSERPKENGENGFRVSTLASVFVPLAWAEVLPGACDGSSGWTGTCDASPFDFCQKGN